MKVLFFKNKMLLLQNLRILIQVIFPQIRKLTLCLNKKRPKTYFILSVNNGNVRIVKLMTKVDRNHR